MKYLKNIHLWLLLFLGALCFLTADAEVLDGFNRMHDPMNQYDVIGPTDVRGVRNVMIRVFKSAGVVLFVVALFIALISVIRLLMSSNGEDDFKKWRDTLLWSLAGLLLISITYYIVDIFDVDSGAAANAGGANYFDAQSTNRIIVSVVYPVLSFLRYIAAFFFLFGAIYGFYRMVTAAGEESGIQAGKRSFIYSVVGFILVFLAEPFVSLLYTGSACGTQALGTIDTECQNRAIDSLSIMSTLSKIIIFLNSFVALVTLIFIIYAGFLILTSGGNQERVDKARKTIFYAIIGIVLLILSYAIYRFFLYQA